MASCEHGIAARKSGFMKKRIVAMVFFLVFSLFLAACSENETAVEEVTNKTFDLSGDVDYCVVDGYRLWYLPDGELAKSVGDFCIKRYKTIAQRKSI